MDSFKQGVSIYLLTLAMREPFSIFSKPSAITQFALAPSTSCLASIRAEEPVEQALFTWEERKDRGR